MVRIGLVDDEATYRRRLRAILERENDLKVVAEAGDGNEVLTLMEQFNPELIIMDIQMPLLNGFEATKLILQGYPETKVILISRTGRREEYVRRATEVGATAFIPKRDLGISVIREALQG